MDADGSEPRNLTHDPGVEAIRRSPDGRRIAFVLARQHEIYVMNADGSGKRRLARTPDERACLVTRRAEDRVLQRTPTRPTAKRPRSTS